MTHLPFNNSAAFRPVEEKAPDRPPSFYEFTPTPPKYRCDLCLEVFERESGAKCPGDLRHYRETLRMGDAAGHADFVPAICDACHGKSMAATNPWQHVANTPNFAIRLQYRLR